jgi:nucleoside-diphosphate-sugar epimerase
MKKILILGAAGFLGQHLEYRLKRDGHHVVSVARRQPPFRRSVADEFNILDLTNPPEYHHHFFRHSFDHVYQLAGNVGGLTFIGDRSNDADVLVQSLKINLNVLEIMRLSGFAGKVLFSSSQCVYPDPPVHVDPFSSERVPAKPVESNFAEKDASFDTFAFGKEKLFSEALYDAYYRNHGIKVAIARIGNTYGPYCVWDGPRAKAPAALCRKIAEVPYGGVVDIIGSGAQTRAFTYVDDVIDGLIRLMEADYPLPVNISHAEQVSVVELFEIICRIANKIVAWKPVDGPVGVQARGSDNTLCKKVLGWQPETQLWHGMALTYPWIRDESQKALTKAMS